jgi:hypothetical protein
MRSGPVDEHAENAAGINEKRMRRVRMVLKEEVGPTFGSTGGRSGRSPTCSGRDGDSPVNGDPRHEPMMLEMRG